MKKMKYLLMVSLLCCFTFMIGTGALSAAAPNTANNPSSDNRSIDGNNYNTNTTGGDYRATAVNDDNDFDWGWLGLLGLIGLAGLRGRNPDRDPQRS